MAKSRSIYVCGACGYETPRWVGKCPGCGAWNSLEESVAAVPEKTSGGKIAANQRPGTGARAVPLKDIPEPRDVEPDEEHPVVVLIPTILVDIDDLETALGLGEVNHNNSGYALE